MTLETLVEVKMSERQMEVKWKAMLKILYKIKRGSPLSSVDKMKSHKMIGGRAR